MGDVFISLLVSLKSAPKILNVLFYLQLIAMSGSLQNPRDMPLCLTICRANIYILVSQGK